MKRNTDPELKNAIHRVSNEHKPTFVPFFIVLRTTLETNESESRRYGSFVFGFLLWWLLLLVCFAKRRSRGDDNYVTMNVLSS